MGAGVSSVISSLWDVDDVSTARLMSEFYLHLRNGESKSRSLQLAKQKVVKEGFRDPFHWAGFTLTGDPAPVLQGADEKNDTGNFNYVCFLCAVGLLILLAVSVSTQEVT
jgi:hypothetical protein